MTQPRGTDGVQPDARLRAWTSRIEALSVRASDLSPVSAALTLSGELSELARDIFYSGTEFEFAEGAPTLPVTPPEPDGPLSSKLAELASRVEGLYALRGPGEITATLGALARSLKRWEDEAADAEERAEERCYVLEGRLEEAAPYLEERENVLKLIEVLTRQRLIDHCEVDLCFEAERIWRAIRPGASR